MAELPSACVIGAGSSGIAALKALHGRGIAVDCFEKSDRAGGNWVFANKNGSSSTYRSLHTNTSRDRMQYSDFPMPRSYPDFPHHTQVAPFMEADIRREHRRIRRRYVASKRHTMEVDFDHYLYRLRREVRAGARRAQAAGFAPPVPARARAAESVDLESA